MFHCYLNIHLLICKFEHIFLWPFGSVFQRISCLLFFYTFKSRYNMYSKVHKSCVQLNEFLHKHIPPRSRYKMLTSQKASLYPFTNNMHWLVSHSVPKENHCSDFDHLRLTLFLNFKSIIHKASSLLPTFFTQHYLYQIQ